MNKMINRKLLPKEERLSFCIADHGMEVVIPDTVDWIQVMPAFQPFKCDSTAGKETICSIRVIEEPIDIKPDSIRVLKEEADQFGYWFCLMESDNNYIVDILFVEDGVRYHMITDKTFSTATAYVDCKDQYADMIVSLFLMIAFGQSAIQHDTFLIHASAVENAGEGYLFLGKSGMGKSTHSQLWLRYVEGSDLLNDDNPAIRIANDGVVHVYGTPWSGKAPCYKNRKVLLKAMVRLEQAPVNRFIWKTGVDALTTLLPSCLSMRWNESLYNRLCNLMEMVMDKVKIGYLECLPDKEAALLCYTELKVF